jgi:hypothetical protein
MKRLVLFFATVFLTGISANIFAQSTGVAPSPGATHNYNITPGDGANTIAWTVWKGDLSTPAGDDVNIDDANAAATDITWASDLVAGDWYYVQVTETDGTCSNTKVLPVQITESNFTLTLAAANATACYDGAVSVSIADNAPVYDHGTATINFTVTPGNLSGSYDGYEFDLSLTVPAGYDPTLTFSANASLTGSTVTVTDNNAVTITYAIDNTNTYNNSSAPDAQDFIATASITNGKTVNGVSENNTADDNEGSTSISGPNTSRIGTN